MVFRALALQEAEKIKNEEKLFPGLKLTCDYVLRDSIRKI